MAENKIQVVYSPDDSVKTERINPARAEKQDTANGFLSNILTAIQSFLTIDFATQHTLALIKAKTDNLDTALSGIKTATDKIPTSPATKDDNYPSGTGTDTSLTLTNATTSYALLSSIPTKNYLLTVYNGSDTDIYLRESTGTTLGFLLPAGGNYIRNMGAGTTLYAYCAEAGKVLNISYRLCN